MRRPVTQLFLVTATLTAAGLLVGCEDGPSQTFQAAPAGAGSLWNNGDTPAVVNTADASLTATFGGSSKTEICSGAELQSQWARMVAQPIVPPYLMAGVNIAGWTVGSSGPAISYQSLTVTQAETGISGALFPAPGATNPPTRLCQGQNLGQGGDSGDVIGGTLQTGWGQNNEFQMEWEINTLKDYYNTVQPGYTGGMTWTYTEPAPTANCSATEGCDGKMHTFTWALGVPIQMDGAVFTLDWNGYSSPSDKFFQEADILYRGLTSAFTPDLFDNLPPGVLCRDTGRCPVFPTGNDYVHPILGFRTISMYWDMDPPVQPQPSGSTPHDAYFFNIKYAPYSPAVSILDMSTATGPSGSLNPIGNLSPSKNCQLNLGGTFGDLTDNCINVFSSMTTNSVAQAKVLGNLTHDDQNFTFSVVGINQNYRPPQLDIGGSRAFDIIHDGELPQPDAVAVDFTLDVRANGPIMNDRFATNVPGVFGRDNRGAGAVFREFARMAQTDLANRYVAANGGAGNMTCSSAGQCSPLPKSVHDLSCLFPMTGVGTGTQAYAWPAGQSPANWRPAPGCTGLEGFSDEAYPNVIGLGPNAGQPVDPNDATQTDPTNVFDVGFGYGDLSNNGLRPGTPYLVICMDPGMGYPGVTYYPGNFCGAPSLYGSNNDLLDGALALVTQIMGNGTLSNLPSGTGDRRYFLDIFTQALSKYFVSGAALHTGQCGGASPPGYCLPPSMMNPDGQAPANTMPSSANNDPVPYFANTIINTDDLFFDSFGGNANRGEFVQYEFADKTHDPTGFNISMLLIGSNLQEEHFYRRLDREERALFEAMGNEDGKAAGQAAWSVLKDGSGNVVMDEWGFPRKNADVFISNIAGSPAIANSGAWFAPSDAMGNPIPVGACTVATAATYCSASQTCTGGVCTGTCKAGTKCTTSASCAAGQVCTVGFCEGQATVPECANGQVCASGSCTAYDPCFPTTAPAMVTKDAMFCASHLDADCPVQAPTNPDGSMITRQNGEPLLAGYCGIWNPSPFALGSQNMEIINKDITPQVQNYEEEAEVVVPVYANPYDPTSTNTPVNVLVPWLPNVNGVGFSVPSTGQTNVFVQTAELDFSGQVIVPVFDYLPVSVTPTGADGGPTGGPAQTFASIQAIESGDFLGDVFLCYDPVSAGDRAGTSQPGDILNAHMYTSAQDILTWIANHPQSQANCSIIVRYSPFDNYPDYISSLSNGVTVNIDQGEGLGRVVDLVLFLPGSGAPAQP